ncbi:Conserved_hypothetical protein [Hexamita inflata]|uniref:Uncharacterized protein n=1 Tax=Hexamita inflata TaxID=28002 RepID=A0AA86QH47_9EUKA|nr:Conserved hypothetical protein [Hexamita inflata]
MAQLYELSKSLAELQTEQARTAQANSELRNNLLTFEKQQLQKSEFTNEQLQTLQKELEMHMNRVRQLELLMNDLNQFQGHKISLTHKLQVIESELNARTATLKTQYTDHLAELARQKASTKIDYQNALIDAFEETRMQTEHQIMHAAETLRSENESLQQEIQTLKSGYIKPNLTMKDPVIDDGFKAALVKKIQKQQKEIVEIEMQKHEQNEKIKTAQNNQAILISQLLRKFNDEKVSAKREMQALEKLLYVKTMELEKVRKIALKILQERADLEGVLYKCLDETFQREDNYESSAKEQMGAAEIRRLATKWIEIIDGEKME